MVPSKSAASWCHVFSMLVHRTEGGRLRSSSRAEGSHPSETLKSAREVRAVLASLLAPSCQTPILSYQIALPAMNAYTRVRRWALPGHTTAGIIARHASQQHRAQPQLAA